MQAASGYHEHWPVGRGSVALSLCTAAHSLHTRFTKIFSTSFSETTMRPKPTGGPRHLPQPEQRLNERAHPLMPPHSRHAAYYRWATVCTQVGRGIYHNKAKTAVNWVNEGDHLRLISMEQGGDVLSVFTRLSVIATAIEEGVKAQTGPSPPPAAQRPPSRVPCRARVHTIRVPSPHMQFAVHRVVRGGRVPSRAPCSHRAMRTVMAAMRIAPCSSLVEFSSSR
jgi:hypothetical protein